MDRKKILIFIKGMVKSIPGIEVFLNKTTGGTDNARYCYSVWLRHLVHAFKNGIKKIPGIVGEVGPGDSLGIGLAALISGSSKYYALDIIKYWNEEKNLAIYDELVELFLRRSDIPDDSEFPNVRPKLSDYKFPGNVLPDSHLSMALARDRLDLIRKNVVHGNGGQAGNQMIQYFVPWTSASIMKSESIDFIYSQAVLEHIDELEFAYTSMKEWLKPGGMMSHVIDFKSHGTAPAWDGHRTYSEFQWKIIRGRKKFLINRIPYSRHIEIINSLKLNLVWNERTINRSVIKDQYSKEFRNMTDEDLYTSGCFVQAVKV